MDPDTSIRTNMGRNLTLRFFLKSWKISPPFFVANLKVRALSIILPFRLCLVRLEILSGRRFGANRRKFFKARLLSKEESSLFFVIFSFDAVCPGSSIPAQLHPNAQLLAQKRYLLYHHQKREQKLHQENVDQIIHQKFHFFREMAQKTDRAANLISFRLSGPSALIAIRKDFD